MKPNTAGLDLDPTSRYHCWRYSAFALPLLPPTKQYILPPNTGITRNVVIDFGDRASRRSSIYQETSSSTSPFLSFLHLRVSRVTATTIRESRSLFKQLQLRYVSASSVPAFPYATEGPPRKKDARPISAQCPRL